LQQRLQQLYDDGVHKYAGQVQRLTRCLDEIYQLHYFSYQKVGKDGSYALLANDPAYIAYYLENQLYLHDIFVHDPALCLNDVQVFLLEGEAQKQDKDLDILYSHCRPNFNIKNNIILRLRHEDYYELFCFGTQYSGGHIRNICTNHLAQLQKFVPHFQQGMQSPIDTITDFSLDIQQMKGLQFQRQNSLERSEREKCERFLEAIHDGAFAFRQRCRRLSPREEESLYWMTQGKTAKETAAILQLSPRTVEEYRENARRKLAPESSLQRIGFLLGKYQVFGE